MLGTNYPVAREKRPLRQFYEMNQGIIDSTGTETFEKEPKLEKLLRELKSKPVS